jgi:hypothetical protein
MPSRIENPLRSRRRVGGGILAAILLAAGGAALAPAQERGDGPTSLILTYRSRPEHRAAFLEHMAGAGVARFEAWRKQGVVAGYQLLFSAYVNESSWDMMVVLDFDAYAGTEAWMEIERSAPGGLSPEGLALAAPVGTQLADRAWEKSGEERDPARAVYFVIPYGYESLGAYKSYVGAYVLPQLDGWVREGIVSRYALYLNQHPTGPVWDALFVLEYKDLAAFSQRDVLKWKIRAGLADDPAWKTISDIKHGFRSEGETTIARAILPR